MKGKRRRGHSPVYRLAYAVAGRVVATYPTLFEGLDRQLRRGWMLVSLPGYSSLVVFASVVTSLAAMGTLLAVTTLVLGMDIVVAAAASFGLSLLAGAVAAIALLYYPSYRASSIAAKLEYELPLVSSFLAVMAGAGAPPHEMFAALARSELTAAQDARRIVRDIALLGRDPMTAVKDAADRAPSLRYKEMLEGIVSATAAGVGLKELLDSKTKEFLRYSEERLKSFVNTLGLLSEFYITFYIAAPLILIITLSTMAMLGGAVAGLPPNVMIALITYLLLPAMTAIFLLILDFVYPKV